MSWSRTRIVRDISGVKNENTPGYCFKLCPYSTAYRDRFKYEGEVCTGFAGDNTPVKQDGVWVMGNSTNPDFHRADFASYNCSDHTTTSGKMFYTSNPPGWICRDPNCYYTTVVDVGRCYREV